MKRNLKVGLIFLASFIFSSSVGGAAQQTIKNVTKVNYKFTINSESVDLANYLVMSKDNTTYVPLRFVSEKLGASVDFRQGEIFIDMLSTPNRPINPTDTQKIQTLEKQIELIKKENSELQKKLDKAGEKLQDFDSYKKLPIEIDAKDGMKIKLFSIVEDGKGASFNVAITNEAPEKIFYFKPEKTSLEINGKLYEPESYSGVLISSLVPSDLKRGTSSVDGSILFNIPYEEVMNGRVTFYYQSNGAEKNQTIYFKK